ncbi:MAG: Lrp/AsnC family transcriptional regulator [Sphingomonadaceae bacterium]|jgi:DNA-binding Lrp family transcriptional regulator|nr:Lrp/AsnC family transcriptional regulator [Sphingomonadaceae bacterium]MCB2086514.1 Lrp/AsnC family transcriptional regulator [Sphingomonadaceae bacterium]MCP5390224.1 Lrp/AsnC family transcriptional regulator [Sphingomonadaceae bacterium]MCP5392443.1 Lrp/AsnC family transcriptional regulator [Sphingomonadaceae bacterium]
MSPTDCRILTALQEDSGQSLARLAEQVNMSHSACHRRVRALEDRKVITGYSARIDPAAVGLHLQAFVKIKLISQGRDAMDSFERAASGLEAILECHLMSGEDDYMLRVAARDLAHFDAIHRESLSRLPGVSAMHSSFSIRQIKPWTGYPVPRDG